jgi:lipopolysaccharide transport system permease protein
MRESDMTSIAIVRIEPTKGWAPLNFRELWEYRELLYFFVWRDVKVRYKQTVLGAVWAIVQPFFTMVVFSLFFGNLAKIPSNGVPYPVFSFAALVPWTFFANGLSQSSNSLVANANLIKKVYFPRLAVPVSTVFAGIIDFALAFIVLLGMILWYSIPLTPNILLLPLFFVLTLITSLGAGLWLSALNVKYRDVRYIVAFLIQCWMFATPIVYPSSLVPEKWRTLFGLNPMAGVVDGFRWALLNTDAAPGPIVAISALTAVIIFITGVFYFRAMEKSFADLV